jgi:adenylate cyclase
MNVEIERKFLVVGRPWEALEGTSYRQGYLSTDPERNVRVRIAGNNAFLTIKGKTVGACRMEFEYELPLCDAQQMLEELCLQPQIEKIRYQIQYERHIWEIDVFKGQNAGLVLAEVEMSNVDDEIKLPPWVGQEVTEDKRFYNVYLAEVPFLQWPRD